MGKKNKDEVTKAKVKDSEIFEDNQEENNQKTACDCAEEAVSDDSGLTDAEQAKATSEVEANLNNNELAAERDRYLRLAAEYDNFRKRSAKERSAAYIDAQSQTIAKLLPIYDNLERALETECSDEGFYKGIELTMTQLTKILEDMNVKPINAVGQQFDPNKHNAVMAIENPELGEKIVVEELQKGFFIGERVLRFSTVVVAN